MSASLLGLYRPGTTALHRLTAGAKLLGMVAVAVVVMVVRGPVSAGVFFAGALLLAAWSGMGLRTVLRSLRGLLIVAAGLAAYLTWQKSWERAAESVLDLLALVLVATVMTVTTPIDEMLDTITRALGPLRRFGVDPEMVALAFSLMIRAVPTTIEIAEETRDAAVARGLERDPRARLTPLVVRVVAHARSTGEALHARGITD